ncbi:MAG TPA: non-heme iron oxygenase ferredoxin subunit [Stellaceae bacterium]|nr:non-heme iron oxygenase ferredoxin subunit [Stellaceae bacterium]
MSGTWVRLAGIDELAEGEILGVEAGGKQIALYNVDGSIYATDNVCSHAYALLSDGYLDGDVIECPLHAGRFEVKTGKALGAPVTKDLAAYPVRVEDGAILVDLG